jgi:hypothetical protein
MNYNYLYISYLRKVESYDSIYETLPTIQGKIPILTTMGLTHPLKHQFQILYTKIYNIYNIFLILLYSISPKVQMNYL